MSESELVAALRKGDAQAQRSAYDLHARKLYPVCLRYMGSEMAAQDCLQDSFIIIFKRIAQFRNDGPLVGWMRKVVVNVCLTALRNRKVEEVEMGSEAELQYIEDTGALGTMTASDLIGLIRALPDGYREVFNLHAIEGYPHHEVASMLGISETNSKVRLSRARLMLQQSLERMIVKS